MIILEPGQKIDRYVIVELLDEMHGRARIIAEDELLGRRVTIELLLAKNPTIVSRFYQSSKLLASLRHPGIAAILQIDEHKGHPYLVKEHIEGRTLEADEPRPLSVTLAIMASVAATLQYAHDRGVVHKLVSPSCVEIGPSGEAFLTGFQIAAPESGDPLLEQGAVMGSPRYMAPEQCRGTQVSHLADVWGLGATLHYFLTGKHPIPGRAATDCLEWLLSPAPVDLQLLSEKVPEYVVSIVERCLQKEPEERFQRADNVRRALETALDHLDRCATTEAVELPRQGQSLLLHVEYRESDRPGSYREYEIDELLGEGSFGTVYRAREAFSGTLVALKILHSRWVSDDRAVARFRREAVIMARLSHSNLLRFRNFGRYGATFFIAMDLIQGASLERIIEEQSPMCASDVIPLMTDILAGLRSLHAAGIVHRDLKPSNIAMDADRAVLLDFGMAYSRDAQKLTLTGMLLGSPAYMSPEQARGATLGPASDVYSAGVVVYEMLTGQRPHEDESAERLLRKIATQRPRPVEDHGVDVTEPMKHALEAMLQADPGHRPTPEGAIELLLAAG